jgi:uncharacterized protein YjdB
MSEAWPVNDGKTCRRARRARSIAIAALLAAFTAGCGSSATSPTTISSIAVTGTAPALGATSQFTASATLMDGTTQDVTTLATWSSSNSTAASVSSSGLVAGIAADTVTIQATYQSVTGSDQITVSP